MKKIENTKRAFQISFFACFALPAFLLTVAAISFFTGVTLFNNFYSWLLGGFIWLLVVIEIMIILIALLLWYTLRLRSIESITTEEVIKTRRRRDPVVVEKVVITTVTSGGKRKRREIGELEKREIEDDKPIVERRSRINTTHTPTQKATKEVPTEPVKETPKQEPAPIPRSKRRPLM